eukprot:159273-Prorocentrum_minimum.AAC.1
MVPSDLSGWPGERTDGWAIVPFTARSIASAASSISSLTCAEAFLSLVSFEGISTQSRRHWSTSAEYPLQPAQKEHGRRR